MVNCATLPENRDYVLASVLMRGKIRKLLRLFSAPNKTERIRSLLEIRLNRLLFNGRPSDALTFDDLLLRFHDTGLANLLQSGGEAEQAVLSTRANFDRLTAEGRPLPFPTYFNADKSLAMLCYALACHLRPEVVIEAGVGYGITSSLILSALENIGAGQLISMDLPSLSDPKGGSVGLAVPEEVRKCWTLLIGGTRRLLPRIMADTGQVDLMISDSANVYTQQRFEFETIWPHLRPSGAMIFNNISLKLQQYLEAVEGSRFYSIWQVEKTSCVTGLVLKE